MVYAPLEIRIQRALQRDHSTEEALRKRIESQVSDEDKKLWTDYIITNDENNPCYRKLKSF